MDRATFVRELAEALAANERRASSSSSAEPDGTPQQPLFDSEDAWIRATYQQLCSDAGWDESPLPNDEKDEEEEPLLLLRSTAPNVYYYDNAHHHVRGIQLLRNALLNRQSPYALSVPLVRGIDRHLLALIQQQQLSLENNNTSTTTAASTNPSRRSLFLVPLLEAYATLAWTVHVQIPWLCCRSTTLDCATLAAYLGSYLDHHPDDAPVLAPPDDDPTPFWPPPPMENDDDDDAAIHNDHDNHNQDDDKDSLAEIWAAESDDSDFEYESDWNPPRVMTFWTAPDTPTSTTLDPRQLSQCTTTSTPIPWNAVARAVTALVQSYGTAMAVSPPVWQRMGGANVQIPLVVALLVPSSSIECPLLRTTLSDHDDDNDDNSISNHWRRLGVYLLNQWQACVWQYCWENVTATGSTAAATATTTSTSTILFLEDYVRLLRILMQASGPGTGLGQPPSAITSARALTEPAVLVSLGSLSFLCSKVLQQSQTSVAATTKSYHSNSTMITTLQSTVLESCPELAELLERATQTMAAHPPHDTDEDEATTTTATDLQWIYLSLLQILTITSNSSTLPARTAQTLLQSGLWRQWLLTALQMASTEKETPVDAAVQLCVLDLCTSSSAMLGKYAWRVPGWVSYVRAGVVVNDDDSNSNGCECSVRWMPQWGWNVLGEHLATSITTTTSSTVVQWKNTAKTPNTATTMPTPAQCRQAAESLWMNHCEATQQILSQWLARRDQPPHCSSIETTARQAAALWRDWQGCAMRLPMLRQCHTDVDHALWVTMREPLLSVQRLLVQWPSSSHPVDRKTDPDDDSDDKDGDNDRNPGSYPKEVASSALLEIQQQDECINGVRKAVKTILSVLEDDCHGGDGRLGSNRQQPHKSYSSKAD